MKRDQCMSQIAIHGALLSDSLRATVVELGWNA